MISVILSQNFCSNFNLFGKLHLINDYRIIINPQIMRKGFLFTAILTMALISSFAQKHDTIVMPEVVVTGSKQPQSPGNITQKIDVVKAVEINSLVTGNRNVAEAIMYKPGVSVSALSRNDANWGTYSGIGPKYSTYMLQGLPIDAFVDPMSLDLSAFDRIEVQRGPASVLYPNYLSQDFAGNQSPLAGTVNLILKDNIEKPLTRVSASYGSYNTLDGQLYHEGNAKNLSYFAGASYEMSDYTNYGTENSWLNMQKDPEYRKTKLFGGLTLHPGNDGKQKLTLFVNKTFHTGDAGRLYRGYNNDYGIINTGYSVELSDRVNLQAHMGLRQYNRTWQESKFNELDTLLSKNGVVQNIVPVDVAVFIKHDKNNLLVVGSDYQGASYSTWSDPLQGYKTYGNKSRATQAGLYAQEEIHIEGLIIRAGLRYSYINNNIDFINGGAPGIKSNDWSSLIWSAGIRYKVNANISFYANGGNSFLTPGLKSVGGTINLEDRGVPGRNGQLPNPDLKPEAGLGVDAGTDISLPANLKFSFRGFVINIDDAIIDNVVSQNPSQTQSINAGKSSSTGFEVEIKQQIASYLHWFVNYTYMKTTVENEYDEDQDGTEIPFAPAHIANLGISISTSFGLSVSPYLSYNGGYYDSSSKNGRTFFKPGELLNIYVAQVLAGNENYKVELFGQFYNLTDNRFEMPWQFQNTGFSGMGGLRVTF
jgi:iron complex outermembrane recepter protein